MIEEGYKELIKKREKIVEKIEIYFYLSAIGFVFGLIGLLWAIFLSFSVYSLGLTILGLGLLIGFIYPLYKNFLERKEFEKEIDKKYKTNIVKR